MKIAIFFLLCCLTLIGFSQVEQLNSGTVVHLRDISVIGQNIIVCGHQDYLIKSTDECKSISTLPIPGPQGYINRLQRLNTHNMMLLSYSTNETLLFKSIDNGNTWIQKSNTSGALSQDFAFFDSLVGLMTTGPFLSKTVDGGSSWSNITAPFSVGMTALKIYGDSTICLGGFSSASAALVLSKDRGHSWPHSTIFMDDPN